MCSLEGRGGRRGGGRGGEGKGEEGRGRERKERGVRNSTPTAVTRNHPLV